MGRDWHAVADARATLVWRPDAMTDAQYTGFIAGTRSASPPDITETALKTSPNLVEITMSFKLCEVDLLQYTRLYRRDPVRLTP